MDAVVPTTGNGNRLRPLTGVKPKILIQVTGTQ